MELLKQGPFSKKPTDLPDNPSPVYSADEIKRYFQTPADELAETLNKVVDELNAVGLQPSTTIGVQAKFEEVDAQLADIAYNAKSNGLKGDGSDDSLKFKDLVTKALVEGKSVYMPKGEFHIYQATLGVSSLNLPSIFGQGLEQTKLVIHGSLNFIIQSGFKCKDLKIESDFVKPNTDTSGMPSVFSNSSTVLKNVLLENTELINTGATTTGSSRGMGLLSAYVDGLKIKNILVTGTRQGFTILNTSTLRSNNIRISNLRFENTQTGMYVQGSETWVKSSYVRSIQADNVSLINTEAQRANYSVLAGSNLFMFEKVRGVNITNMYVERACERATYFNCCDNVNVVGVELVSSAGLKFVGLSSVSAGQQYADGFTCSNVHIVDEDNIGAGYYGFFLYDCKNIKISDVSIDGKGNATKIIQAFATSRYIENLTIENITARYMQKGFFWYDDEIEYATSVGIKDFTAKNITLIDPEISAWRWDLFYFDISATAQPTNGTYLFNNFRLENITSKCTVDYSATSPAIGQKEYLTKGDGKAAVNGLIGINHINGFRAKRNVIEGFSNPNSPIFIGTNARNIVVEEDNFWVNLTVAPSSLVGLNYSFPTTVRMIENNTSSGSVYEYTLKSITEPSDTFGVTRNLLLNCEIDIKSRFNLGSTLEEQIMKNWVTSCYGIGRVMASNGEWLQFAVNGTTVTKIASSVSFGVANDAGMSSVFVYGSPNNFLVLRNRTAGTLNYKLEFKGIYKQ